jgi:polar amino acid transport system substrate-binding protein
MKHTLMVLAIAAMAGILPGTASADVPIELLYSERPPFMYMNTDGTLEGTAATPAIRAFKRANIGFVLREASPARRLGEVKENAGRVCSIGLYKTPEREVFARFSKSVSQDSKMIALASPRLQVPKVVSVSELLQRTDVSVLVKDKISYGHYLEAQFATMKAQRVGTTAEYEQLFRMIKNERAQLLFLPEEEARFYLAQTKLLGSDSRLITFKGMPPGEKRYITCSKSVPDDVLESLNKAIANPRP